VTGEPGFLALPDLASRKLGGSVVAANDELFAEKENLIKPEPPVFAVAAFGHKGKVYDGWETRRRREPGHDYAIVRLGAPGIVHGVVVDTSFFRGNYPPQVSVEGASTEGYLSPGELAGLDWQPLVARSDVGGDAANVFAVNDQRRWTHVRLSIYPDGGVARLRVHGEPAADPAYLAGTVDLAALENGGQVVDCSDAFYGSAVNLIMPGRARSMADGWENARRRDAGHDHVTIALAGSGVIRHVEIDTSYFVGNAPGAARLLAAELARADDAAVVAWREVLPPTRLQPDTRHRFVITDDQPASHVRLEVFPDGGLARLRVNGEITPAALALLTDRYRSCRSAR
jgi:allantoicase